MKKVLIMIDAFPPSSVVYSLRFYKLMKHIGKYDWEPFILTQKSPIDGDRYDDALLKSLPEDITIFRIGCMGEINRQHVLTTINSVGLLFREFGVQVNLEKAISDSLYELKSL